MEKQAILTYSKILFVFCLLSLKKFNFILQYSNKYGNMYYGVAKRYSIQGYLFVFLQNFFNEGRNICFPK